MIKELLLWFPVDRRSWMIVGAMGPRIIQDRAGLGQPPGVWDGRPRRVTSDPRRTRPMRIAASIGAIRDPHIQPESPQQGLDLRRCMITVARGGWSGQVAPAACVTVIMARRGQAGELVLVDEWGR